MKSIAVAVGKETVAIILTIGVLSFIVHGPGLSDTSRLRQGRIDGGGRIFGQDETKRVSDELGKERG